MRKALVAIAALSLFGTGAIAQSVSFSGSANMGFIYGGEVEETVKVDGKDTKVTKSKSGIKWLTNFDLVIAGSGTTDGGLTFGAETSIDGNKGGGDIDDTKAYIGGESWKISIGDLDPASDKGKTLGDVGYDGLGVDNVAEFIGGTEADVEVSFSLGAASLAITAGQTGGTDYVPEVGDKPSMFRYDISYMIGNETIEIPILAPTGTRHANIAAVLANLEHNNMYIHTDDTIWVINGVRDTKRTTTQTPGVDQEDDAGTTDVDESDDGDTRYEDEEGSPVSIVTDSESLQDTTFIPGTPFKSAEDATGQDNQWAAGVSFDIGATTLGLGVDSEKLMQASVGADLGSFTGKLFYSQQKMSDTKRTGMGVEIGVSAGADTTINAVYAQGKTDYPDSSDMKDKTDKGFGVGVSHGLGGGATLQAGFAKVKKQTMASVGVSMSF